MNEKIKQLAIAAKLEHCVSHARLQEFAELIVLECLDVVDEEVSGMLGVHVMKKIAEHFGVE